MTEKEDELEVVLEDEEAAHQDTLSQLATVKQQLADVLPAAQFFCWQHAAAKSAGADKACKPSCPYPKTKAVLDAYGLLPSANPTAMVPDAPNG